MGLENTPPPSPGVGGLDEDDQIYEDEIAEEIDIGEGTLEVSLCDVETTYPFCDGILLDSQFRMTWAKKRRTRNLLSCLGGLINLKLCWRRRNRGLQTTRGSSLTNTMAPFSAVI